MTDQPITTDTEPARTEPTEEQVAQAIYDTLPMRMALARPVARNAARAVLALLPQRCAPSMEEIAHILQDEAHSYVPSFTRLAHQVAALFAAQPTVREAKAAGWDEGVADTVDAFWAECERSGQMDFVPLPRNPYERSK